MKGLFILLMIIFLGVAVYYSFEGFLQQQSGQETVSQTTQMRMQYEAEFGDLEKEVPRSYDEGVVTFGDEIRNFIRKYIFKPQE